MSVPTLRSSPIVTSLEHCDVQTRYIKLPTRTHLTSQDAA